MGHDPLKGQLPLSLLHRRSFLDESGNVFNKPKEVQSIFLSSCKMFLLNDFAKNVKVNGKKNVLSDV